jgi:hypothetical protein
VAVAVALVSLTVVPAAGAADAVRVDLKVLVVDDGGAPTQAIMTQLRSELVPFTVVDLRAAGRPVINQSFLSDTVGTGPRAKFQSVLLPNEAPPGLTAAELTALHDYERTFGIRQVDASTWAHPGVGLNYAEYVGSLDGATASVDPAGVGGAFGYLRGSIRFADVSADVAESYGFVARPLGDDPVNGTSFTTLVSMPLPNGGTGSLAGVYHHDGRQELVITFAYNADQRQFRALAHGIIKWMTAGVKLGQLRYWFSMHVDDVFLPDDRWSITGNCTPGDDCNPTRDPAVEPYTELIRMTPADVDAAVAWQQSSGFQLQLAYNGFGSVEAQEQGAGEDPLTTRLELVKDQFWWINHTYSHPYLGCVQDFSVVPWRCQQDPVSGAVLWVPRSTIETEIQQNLDWGSAARLPLDRTELITGEHSGLRSLPQMPQDNPNLGPAIKARGIKSLASDASREPDQRVINSVPTVPRHPMNIFYNVADEAEETDEYNWIYTSQADGGSGICEHNPGSTCIEPLDLTTGFDTYIAPTEARIALSHVLAIDPRPHYAHQSNLAGDRILYAVLDRVLQEYRQLFADNTPLLNPRMSAIAVELSRWTALSQALANGQVYGYRIGNTVTIHNASSTNLYVTMTVPAGTNWGEAYAGERSGWGNLNKGRTLTVTLPSAGP